MKQEDEAIKTPVVYQIDEYDNPLNYLLDGDYDNLATILATREIQDHIALCIAELKAEIERLKAALTQINDTGYMSKLNSVATLIERLNEHVEIARQALSEK